MANQFFEEFKTFPSLEQAQEYVDLLDKSNIEYTLEKVTPIFDPAFAGNTANDSVVLKLHPSDFIKADKVYADAQMVDLEALVKDYYLFSFTDEELIDVIVKKEEWSEFDYVLAQKLLKDRGKEVSPEILAAIRKQRFADLSQFKPYPKTWIIAGYIFAFLGGLISIFIGLQLMWDNKRLLDGTKMYAYEPNARSHGRIILTLGIVVLIFTLLSNMFDEFEDVFNR